MYKVYSDYVYIETHTMYVLKYICIFLIKAISLCILSMIIPKEHLVV